MFIFAGWCYYTSVTLEDGKEDLDAKKPKIQMTEKMI